MVIAAAVGFKVSTQREPVYSATATLVLVNPGAEQGRGFRADELSQWVAMRSHMVTDPTTLREAAAIAGGGVTPEQLADDVKVTQDANLLELVITADGPDPRTAATRANAVATAYQQAERRQITADVEKAAERFQARLDQVNRSLDDASATLARRPLNRGAATALASGFNERTQLEKDAAEAREAARAAAASLRTINEATPPTSPTAPRPVQDGAVTGLATGLVVTGALLQYRARRRRNVGRAEDAERLLHLPLLSELDDVAPGTWQRERDEDVEALGFAVATLSLELGPEGGVVVLVSPGDPAPTWAVALGIAAAARRARWWKDVTLLDWGRPGNPALVDLSRGVVEDTPVPAGGPQHGPGGEVGVEAVAALESVSSVSSADLDWRTAGASRADGRLVVVRGPVLERNAELAAAVLSSDRVLLVVSDRADKREVSASRDVLAILRANLLGFVFVRRVGQGASWRASSPSA
jgi:capsular polysaccharide biosynthesis protein